ncbi:hypothetical protein CFN78_01795 [Amycolatopsis antarctica]|uniref:Uncharacterized protein n=1 Tax=Amycolatopsis antarctica TaxID=1854586 RepID=A0A263D9U7_9PSEU|nr:hypothetical protein [Amycolatopsis antarctica]OZM74959.1 hypothetical protein CFN78_01795 [Amycolatopsis antarctica]
MLSGGLGAAVASALLLAVGVVLPVTGGAGPGFSSAALLIALAVLPAALAAGFALRGSRVTAAAVVAGAAALAPGRALADLQFAIDPSTTSRPELYLPATLDVPAPGPGLWLLLAGHIAAMVAGVLAFRALSRYAEAAADADERRRPVLAVTVGLVAAIGLLTAPITSSDAYLLAQSAFEGPMLVLAGHLLLACALPLAVVLATGSGLREAARGGLLGLAAALVAIALPPVVSGLAVPVAGVAGGPVAALAAAAGLVLLALAPGGRAAADRQATRDATRDGDLAGEARLPGGGRLLTATGVLAVLTALAALGGALGATVESASGTAVSDSPSRPWLLVAGVLVGLLGIAVLVPRCAALVRPALAVAWSGVFLAGTSVIDTALTAGALPAGPTAGEGVLWTVLAMIAAIATAACAVVAGMVERDDSDSKAEAVPAGAGSLLSPLVAAGILAVAGLTLPAIAAPDYLAPGLWSGFGTPSWGLAIVLVTVLGAAVLAPRSRPARAVALLGGAAAVLGLRAAELPLGAAGTDGGIPGATAAPGTWLALAGAAAFAVAAVVVAVGRNGESAGQDG